MRVGVMALALVAVGLAQDNKPVETSSGYFRLEFVVKELDGGKVVNARAYSTIMSTEKGGQSSIRTGSRVPSQNAAGYVDVGINFDCRAPKVVGNDFAVYVSAEINSVAEPASTPPVTRTNRWGGDVIVPLKKPTVVFSSDDAASKRQMQLELTATPIR